MNVIKQVDYAASRGASAALTKVYFGQEQFVRFIGAGNDFPILPLANE